MTLFAALAAALTAITVAFLVVPLARRRRRGAATQAEASLEVLREDLDELERERAAGAIGREDYEAAKKSLKVRILEDAAPEAAPADRARRAPAIVLAAALPLAAAALYAWLGNPAALDPKRVAGAPEPDAARIEAMVVKLARRLRDGPDDPEGWTMLARSYRVLGRHAEAAAAFERAEKRVSSDPQLLTDWAESAALAAGRRLAGKPEELIARALAIAPEHAPALALAGAAAFERGDWKGAVARWERLAKHFAPGSEDAQAVAQSIAMARERLGEKPAAAAATPTVSGRVSLAASLSGNVSPTDTVYVFARAASGRGAPLAVLRKHVRDLPVEFTLDDSMAMAPNAKLSGASEVIVGARVSRSGSATPQSGDLEGKPQRVKVGAAGVDLVIDSRRP